jgi:tyrosine-protein kinase
VKEDTGQEVRSLSDYLRVVRRRKWLILTIAVSLPVAAVLYSLSREPLYRASAEVLLSRTTPVADITGASELTFSQQPDRFAKTEAGVAAVPAVAERVLEAVGDIDMTPEEFHAQSSATAKADADLLVLSVDASDPKLAAVLATEYARQFTEYRKEFDTAAIRLARLSLESRIAELRRNDQGNEALSSDLQAKALQLGTAEALATGSTSVIREATAGDATKIRPHPLRDGFLAAGIGLLLGIVVAFFRDAVDTRVRSAQEIAERLPVPLLARIPEPPRPLQMSDRLIMLAEPNGKEAEAFRMLRTNLEFVNLERRARTIMVTSASEREGKSTTVANLAIALARAGKDVVLVDLDLRQPFLHTLFDLECEPGLTNVVLDAATLEQALSKVWASETHRHDAVSANAVTGESASTGKKKSVTGGEGNGRTPLGGFLEVMPAGTLPPNPGEFVATRALGTVLKRLGERADFVLVDVPPLIGFGDAMTISANVDGVVLVTRMNVLRRPLLGELHRLLGTSPAETLGFVVTGAEAGDDQYGDDFDGYYMGSPTRGGRERVSRSPADRSPPENGVAAVAARAHCSDMHMIVGKVHVLPYEYQLGALRASGRRTR